MSLADDVARACARIAPAWPLDRAIAVNPWWGLVDRPFEEVAGALSAEGLRPWMPRAWYREALAEGRFDTADLAEAAGGASVAGLLARLEGEEAPRPVRARVIDVCDLRPFVVDAISRFCARWFDEGQASLPLPRDGGLYRSWARHARADRGPVLALGAGWEALTFAADAEAAIARAVDRLGVPEAERERYLWGALLDVHGWAAWCAGRRFAARQQGADDDTLSELLAIRLAWEEALLILGGRDIERRWHRARAAWPAADAVDAPEPVFQRALEIGTRKRLLGAFGGARAPGATPPPTVQAVFCIDVRSEVYRRALEAEGGDAVQTLGFAGFFGLPIAYRPPGAHAARPQLPGLLAPRFLVEDAADGAGPRRLRGIGEAWRRLKTGPLASFAFVESLGWGYAGKLVTEALGLASDAVEAPEPRLVSTVDGEPVTLAMRVDLAEGMLRAMSLTRGFARTVLLVGHGSSARNNPQAAALDCGACGGQRGDVNARVAAALLDAPEVREGLRARGIDVPASTRFVAGLHDTTTDEVTLFGADPILRGWLDAASRRARAERAPRLGEPDGERLLRRARDWAQVRPEWGLAGNAAIVFAPRALTRGLDLQGRVFLHDYRAEDDDGRILELLLTAPMVVAHWINLQYYASTVDNGRFGTGDKNLHDVVGGHLGVFEGNGGDLRIGLPLQSLHDGTRWVHTPVRLSVYVAASPAAVDAVLARHPTVRALVDNGWVSLFVLGEAGATAYRAAA